MKPLTAKDRYKTPGHIVLAVERALNMRLEWDVCADSESSVTGPEKYAGLDRGENALNFWWYKRLAPRTVCWMNPPYSQLTTWVRKARVEASRGLIVVGMVPDMRSSRWFQDHVEGQASLCLLPDGRINFDPPNDLDPRKRDVYMAKDESSFGCVNRVGDLYNAEYEWMHLGQYHGPESAKVAVEREFRARGKGQGSWLSYSSNPWPSCVPVWTPWVTGQTQYVRFNRRQG